MEFLQGAFKGYKVQARGAHCRLQPWTVFVGTASTPNSACNRALLSTSSESRTCSKCFVQMLDVLNVLSKRQHLILSLSSIE